ncbi:hypothetical protein MRB53_037581 [Persea americana]|nr:hypothetical protein MRB53_037581 [Persea americana]
MSADRFRPTKQRKIRTQQGTPATLISAAVEDRRLLQSDSGSAPRCREQIRSRTLRFSVRMSPSTNLRR